MAIKTVLPHPAKSVRLNAINLYRSFLFCVFLYACAAFGQASQICTYRWNASTSCAAQVPCLDSTIMQGKIITVPSNISRIAADGLKLCLSDQNITSPADIVYIVDMSGSMVQTNGQNGTDPYFKRAGAVKSGFDYQVDSVPGSYAGLVAFAGRIVSQA